MLSNRRDSADHRHDRPAASGHPHHHHGHLPAGLLPTRTPRLLPRRSTTRSPARPRSWWPPARPSSGSSAFPSSTSAFPSPPSPWWRARCETEDYVPFAVALDRAAADLRRQLHRRLFRPGAEGHDRLATSRLIALHSRGAGRRPSWSAPPSTWAPPGRASIWMLWR